jgi:hypothetical protein
MNSKSRSPKPGERVFLREIPPELLKGLPLEDKRAISEMLGKSVLLTEYRDDGMAELEFRDAQGVIHFIYVNTNVLTPIKQVR